MCQKVYNRVLPLSTVFNNNCYLGIDPQFRLFINWNFCFWLLLFFFLFSSHLLSFEFNFIRILKAMEWNFFQPKKRKKITLFFSLSARPCSHRPFARGRKDILAAHFFAEELFVSLISVKFAFRLRLLQPTFQGRILLFLRSVSLISESRRGPWEQGCVYCRIEHKTVVQSCYKSGKIWSSPPENRYWAMTTDE